MLMLFVPDDVATLAEIVILALFAVISFVPDRVGRAHVALVVVEEVLVFGVALVERVEGLVGYCVEDGDERDGWRGWLFVWAF